MVDRIQEGKEFIVSIGEAFLESAGKVGRTLGNIPENIIGRLQQAKVEWALSLFQKEQEEKTVSFNQKLGEGAYTTRNGTLYTFQERPEPTNAGRAATTPASFTDPIKKGVAKTKIVFKEIQWPEVISLRDAKGEGTAVLQTVQRGVEKVGTQIQETVTGTREGRTKIGKEEFLAKLEKTKEAFVKGIQAHSRGNEEGVKEAKAAMLENLQNRNIICSDEHLNERMTHYLDLSSEFVSDRLPVWVMRKENELKTVLENALQEADLRRPLLLETWIDLNKELAYFDTQNIDNYEHLLQAAANIQHVYELSAIDLIGEEKLNEKSATDLKEYLQKAQKELDLVQCSPGDLFEGVLEQQVQTLRTLIDHTHQLLVEKGPALTIENTIHLETLQYIRTRFGEIDLEIEDIKVALDSGDKNIADFQFALESLELELNEEERRLEDLSRKNPSPDTSLAITNFQNFIAETRAEIEVQKNRLK